MSTDANDFGRIQEEACICGICPHACALKEGQIGICKARQPIGGKIIDQNYGRITSMALDPIEKKPLAMFMPGSLILSIGSYGCNLRCPFCQNASIACAGADDVPWEEYSVEELVNIASKLEGKGNIGIAYTYNEPLVGFEFVRDLSKEIRSAGMLNVVVSNGMIEEGPLSELLPYMDAANIDLKTFNANAYSSLGGDLECVKRTIEMISDAPKCHLEVTTLVVPGISDDAKEMEEMTSWLSSLDSSIPYHLSRFFPCWKMSDLAPTDISELMQMKEIAESNLDNVFLGNV